MITNKAFLMGGVGVLLFILLLAGCITITKKDGADKPAATDMPEKLLITLERTACFGECPVYSLTIFGNGNVVYEGKEFVRVKGTKETTISKNAINELVLEFEKADYFSLNDSYTGFGKSDMPSAITSIFVGGKTKAIRHYLGDNNAPKQLTTLENKIDEIVNSAQWIK